jgi:hypothetical protein
MRLSLSVFFNARQAVLNPHQLRDLLYPVSIQCYVHLLLSASLESTLF